MVKNICKLVKCPYFGESGNQYGCQRYAMSCGCHLRVGHELESSEYIVYVQNNVDIDIDAIKRENDRWMMEDEKYEADLKFQSDRADWLDENTFKVKQISL